MERDPSDEEKENPLVTELADDALAPYRDLVPPETLAAMAGVLDVFLTTHPVASRMVRGLQPDAVPNQSHERNLSGDPAAEEAQKPSGTEGGSR